MASKGSQNSEQIEIELNELEINMKRLRIEYEQFFKGGAHREPQQLLAKVQKTVTRFASDPPRRVALKFRFNSLVARFQSQRQLWGRIMREMDEGSYKPHQFRMKLHGEAADETPVEPRAASEPAKKKSGIDSLTDALLSARKMAGQHDPISREEIVQMVRKQTRALRDRYGDDAKISFKVVVEDGRAKLKANVKKRA